MAETSKRESQNGDVECGACGAFNPPESVFCLRCGGGLGKTGNSERGSKIKELEIKSKICGNCGATNPSDSKDCLSCGGGLV